MDKEFITLKEAAQYLGVQESYLYKLTMQKKIPYYKPFGKLLYFKRQELDQIIGGSADRKPSEIDLSQVPTNKLLSEISNRGFKGTLSKSEKSERDAYTLQKEQIIRLR